MADIFANINTNPGTTAGGYGNLFANINTGGQQSPQPQASSTTPTYQAPTTAPQPQTSSNPLSGIGNFLGQVTNTAGSLVKQAISFIPQIPGYTESAIQNPGETLAGAGEKVLEFGGSLGGMIEQGIVSNLNNQPLIGISGVGGFGKPNISVPAQWDMTKQTQAFTQMNDQLLKSDGIDHQKAFAVGQFLGSFLPYALASEASAATVGESLLVPTAEKFAAGAVKFVPRINNALGFLGINQLEYDPQNGSRVDQFRNDLITLGLFEIGGIAAEGLSNSTKGLITKAVDSVKDKPVVDMETAQPIIEQAKNAIQQDTGKPAPVLVANQIASGEIPKGAKTTQEIAQSSMASTVVNRNIADLITHEEAPDTQTIAQYKQAIDSGSRPALVVTQEGDKWAVEDGKHKLEAYKQAGITQVPTIEKTIPPEIKQLYDLRSTQTPDDATLNPIADNIGAIIKENGPQETTRPQTNIAESTGNQGGENTNPESNQAAQRPNEQLDQNSGQPQTTGIPGQGERVNQSDQELQRRQGVSSGSEPTNTASESTNSSTGTVRSREGLKVSKIAKEIDAKAVERGLTEGYSQLAGYTPITIKDQAARAADLLNNHFEDAQAIIRGEKPLPEGLKGTSLITAMEEHLTKNPSAESLMDLARSPLVSGTSQAAQELRLAAERDPYSPLGIIKQLENDRRAVVEKQAGQSIDHVIKEETAKIQKAIAKTAPDKNLWKNFISTIECGGA